MGHTDQQLSGARKHNPIHPLIQVPGNLEFALIACGSLVALLSACHWDKVAWYCVTEAYLSILCGIQYMIYTNVQSISIWIRDRPVVPLYLP